jgi:hypothetical protein
MFKSSRKKLIAAGCSFTEHNLSSNQSPNIDWDFTRWPQHLADMLNMECVNLGRCGAGNDQILARTLDVTLKEKDIGLVVIMWSEWQRIDFQRYKDQNAWHQIRPLSYPRESDCFALKEFLSLANPRHATRQALRQFIHAEKILKDLPYIFIQGTFNVPSYSTTELEIVDCSVGSPNEKLEFTTVNDSRKVSIEEIIKSPYLDYIEKNIGDKFIGWPIMREIGGYSIDDKLDEEDINETSVRWSRARKGGRKLRISKDDAHPNAAGHKFIADFLYEHYKEIYNDY